MKKKAKRRKIVDNREIMESIDREMTLQTKCDFLTARYQDAILLVSVIYRDQALAMGAAYQFLASSQTAEHRFDNEAYGSKIYIARQRQFSTPAAAEKVEG